VATSDDIHSANEQAIAEFKRDLTLEGLSDAWLSKLLGHLVIIAKHVEKTRFQEREKEDIKDLVQWVQSRETEAGESVSDVTVSAYKQVIKRFWRWLADMPKGDNPEKGDWIIAFLTPKAEQQIPTATPKRSAHSGGHRRSERGLPQCP